MSMKRGDIEPGMLIGFMHGMTREVISMDLEARPKMLTYRQASLGTHQGSGCIPVGQTKTVALDTFAYKATGEVTVEMTDEYAKDQDWIRRMSERVAS